LSPSNEARHDQLHRALVERMATNLRPRLPLWPVRRRLALWLMIEVAVLVRAMVVTGNDFAMKLRHPPYALEIGFFGIAGLILAAMALKASIPGRESRPCQMALAVTLVLGGTLILFAVPMRTDLPAIPHSVVKSVGKATCEYKQLLWHASSDDACATDAIRFGDSYACAMTRRNPRGTDPA